MFKPVMFYFEPYYLEDNGINIMGSIKQSVDADLLAFEIIEKGSRDGYYPDDYFKFFEEGKKLLSEGNMTALYTMFNENHKYRSYFTDTGFTGSISFKVISNLIWMALKSKTNHREASEITYLNTHLNNLLYRISFEGVALNPKFKEQITTGKQDKIGLGDIIEKEVICKEKVSLFSPTSIYNGDYVSDRIKGPVLYTENTVKKFEDVVGLISGDGGFSLDYISEYIDVKWHTIKISHSFITYIDNYVGDFRYKDNIPAVINNNTSPISTDITVCNIKMKKGYGEFIKMLTNNPNITTASFMLINELYRLMALEFTEKDLLNNEILKKRLTISELLADQDDSGCLKEMC